MRRHAFFWIAVALVALGCSRTEAPSQSKTTHFPAMPQKGEWFWKDNLLPDDLAPIEPKASGPSYAELVAVAGRNPAAIEGVVKQLASAGGAAIPELAAGLVHADRTVNYAAVCALSRMHDPLASRALILGFRHALPEIGVLAVQGALAQDDPWIVPRVIVEFGWRDVNPTLAVRVAGAALLLAHQWMGGIPLLIKVLKENTPIADESNREWDRRERIAWEKEMAIAALRDVLGSDFEFSENAPTLMQVDMVRRIEAAYQQQCVQLNERTPQITDGRLIGLIRRLIGGLNTFQLRNVDDARFVLETLGPRVAPFLIEGAYADAFYTRYHCLEVLARFREEATAAARTEWCRAIEPVASDADAALREQLATTLGELASPGSTAVLEKLLQDPELDVRSAAALALGRMALPAALDVLQRRFPRAPATSADQVAILAAQVELGSEPALEAFLQGLLATKPEVSSSTLDLIALLTAKDLRPPQGQPWQPEKALNQARELLRQRYFAENQQGKPEQSR